MRRYAIAGISYGLSVSVYACLSVTSRSSIKTDKSIELVSGMRASFQQYYTGLKKSGYLQNSLWNFAPNSELRKFCFRISIVEMCYQLSSTKVDAQSVINWTVVSQQS